MTSTNTEDLVDIARLEKGDTAYAVIHAILPHHAKRLLDGDSSVFGKYMNYETSDSLEASKRFLVYVSHESKQIVADAEIARIKSLLPEEISKSYRNRFFLSSTELESYSRGRRKPLLVFELRNLRRFHSRVTLRRPITMAGLFINRSEYDRLLEIGMKNHSREPGTEGT